MRNKLDPMEQASKQTSDEASSTRWSTLWKRARFSWKINLLESPLGYLWGLGYRVLMRVAHRYNWHYAPPCYLRDGDRVDRQLWCRWCGFRQTQLWRVLKPW